VEVKENKKSRRRNKMQEKFFCELLNDAVSVQPNGMMNDE
jgi:hypothetical protein